MMNNLTKGIDFRNETADFQWAGKLGRDDFVGGEVGRSWWHEFL